MTNARLSIFSVVRNEREMIEDMLKSAQGADEHVVIDTGSTDETLDICRKYTDKIYTDYKWADDFSEAKNLAISRCTGEWTMGLDADCRLEPGGIQKIRDAIDNAPDDVNALYVRLVKGKHTHYLSKIFRMSANPHYVGKAHEVPSLKAVGDAVVDIHWLYSPRHKDDPDRNIRILLTDDLTKPRTQFYLGREYYERRRYDEALEWFSKYLENKGTWAAERAEAWLCVAQMYWWTQRGDKAREACLQAINCAPDFKEALLLMSEMHYSPSKEIWKRYADCAKNTGVMFVRT